MPKVKKSVRVTGKRRSRGKSVRKSTGRPLKRSAAKKVATVRPPAAPIVEFQVRELDPQVKCGEHTSVQFLNRVIERADGRTTNHLVFFDQHGWYCEHGRTCPAVAHAKKFVGWAARD